MLRFERRDNRVLLRGISYEVMASDTTSPVAGAVAASNVHPIIAMFNVEAYGPDSAAVIDVSRLFTQPPPELSPAQRIGRGLHDGRDAFVDRARASFPDNVNVSSTLTLAQRRRRSRRGDGNAGSRRSWRRGGHGAVGDDRDVVQLPQAARRRRCSRGSATTASATSR